MNKLQKFLTVFGVSALSVIGTQLTVKAQQMCTVQGTPGSPTIEVRNAPGSSNNIATINVGTQVTMQSASGDWIQVSGPSSNGSPVAGWVYAPYLNCGAANRPLVGAGKQTCQVQAPPGGEPFIGLRDKPNNQGAKIGSVNNGTPLVIDSVSPDNQWAMVSGNGMSGWAWRAYLVNCR